MKKTFKKLSALLIAAVMVFAMAMPAFAADHKPVEGETPGTISVTNVEEGATVKAFQIVKADYNAAGFAGTYSLTDDAKAAIDAIKEDDPDFAYDMQDPDASAVAKIASKMEANGATSVALANYDNGTYTSDEVAAGQYIVLVKGTNKNIYNPMVVALAYDNEKPGNMTDVVGGEVAGNTDFAYGNTASAKHTTTNAEKKIIDSEHYEDENGDVHTMESKGVNGDDVAVGDTINFELTATIPQYNTDIYTNPFFKMTDEPDTRVMEIVSNNSDNRPVITVDDVAVAVENYELTISAEKMEVKFASDWIKDNLGKEVKIVLQGKLKDGAKKGFDANTNTYFVEYSNNPSQDFSKEPGPDDLEKILDYVDEYTFDVVFEKTDDENERLDGAGFTLYYDEDCTLVVRDEVLSGSDGYAEGLFGFKGLDADHTYYMKETTTPAGFAPLTTVYEVKIADVLTQVDKTETFVPKGEKYTDPKTGEEVTAECDTIIKGCTTTVESYTVTFKNLDTESEKTTTYESKDDEGKRVDGSTVDGTVINTSIPTLPSTGGMGTALFTIAGVAILAIAATMLVMKRRKA